MKTIVYLLFFAAAITVTGCQSGAEKAQPAPGKTMLQPFSDTVQNDTFRVSLEGETSSDMKLLFTITNYRGQQIYKEEIKASAILANYLASEDLKKESDKIKFLNDEVNFFFDEEHFLIPAVAAEEEPDQNVPDKAFYEELKQSGRNGFAYSLGKDKQIYIAWSALEQKVKVYYRCC